MTKKKKKRRRIFLFQFRCYTYISTSLLISVYGFLPVLKIKPGCNNSNLKVDGLSLADKQAAQPKSKEQRSSAATYENRAEGDEYKQRTMSELRNPFSALSSFNLSG